MQDIDAGAVGEALVVVGLAVAATVRVEDERTNLRTLHAVANLLIESAAVGVPLTILARRASDHLRATALTGHQVAIAVAITIAFAVAITIAVAIAFAIAVSVSVSIAIAITVAIA